MLFSILMTDVISDFAKAWLYRSVFWQIFQTSGSDDCVVCTMETESLPLIFRSN